MDSRQQFEEWYLRKYYEGNRAAGICWLVREDFGRYTYAMPAEHFRTWQASRESIAVELPEPFWPGYIEEDMSADLFTVDQITGALADQGITVK